MKIRKIGAAALAAALMAGTAITASAEQQGASMTMEIKDIDGGKSITINNLPAELAECDLVMVDIYFPTIITMDGETKIDHNNRYWVSSGTYKDQLMSMYIIYDSQNNNESLRDNKGGSGLAGYSSNSNSYIIGLEDVGSYYNAIFSDCNAIGAQVYGIKDGSAVCFDNNGNPTDEPFYLIQMLPSVGEENTSSEPTRPL